MCLREGDNVATRNPRSSAETWHASISCDQLELFKLRTLFSFVSVVIFTTCIVCNVSVGSQQQLFWTQSKVNLSINTPLGRKLERSPPLCNTCSWWENWKTELSLHNSATGLQSKANQLKPGQATMYSSDLLRKQ